MVGEIFEITAVKWLHSNFPPWLEKIMRSTALKWLQMHSNCRPPWLEKIMRCTALKRLEMHSNCPSWLEKMLTFTALIHSIHKTVLHVT